MCLGNQIPFKKKKVFSWFLPKVCMLEIILKKIGETPGLCLLRFKKVWIIHSPGPQKYNPPMNPIFFFDKNFTLFSSMGKIFRIPFLQNNIKKNPFSLAFFFGKFSIKPGRVNHRQPPPIWRNHQLNQLSGAITSECSKAGSLLQLEDKVKTKH